VRSIATGLRSFLDGHASSDGAQVFIRKGPKQESPPDKLKVIQRMSTENYTTLDDPGDDSLRAETFRITTYARGGTLEADTTADAMAEALDDYSGAMGSDRVCEAVFIEDESGDYDPPLYVDGFDTADLVVTIQHSPAA
jgi:hypothetical protein